MWALVEQGADVDSSRNAIEDPDRSASITYGELLERVQQLKTSLERHGVRSGDRVGICAPKSIDSVIALLATLAAGAAYVPVDYSAPSARNIGIFQDCAVAVIFAATSLADGLISGWNDERIEVLEELERDHVLLGSPALRRDEGTSAQSDSPAELAYILYTSGSTGKPKGVVHTHGSALAFIDWCSEEFAPTANDRFSSHAPFHFDLSILDLYVPLKHGATLVLIGEQTGKQPALLASVIAESRISVWYSTPSILRLLADYGKLAERDYSALRLVLFAGEVFPLKHFHALRQFWSHPVYYNLYGPTETNVCTYYRVPDVIAEERTESFPIGFTCSDDKTIVVDTDGETVQPGAEGELLVAGGSVMQGYWNLPERTAEAFLVDSSGLKWYHTGDIVRETESDGYLFVGRRDRMVKRRGYRIELGEIEAALYKHPLVKEVAVTAGTDNSDVVIIAHLALSTETRPTLVQLKRFCTENLTSYMIPDRFQFYPSLPKTSTDKTDYERLRRES